MAGPTQEEKRELFERHFLLGRLNSQEIDALLAYTRVERYRAGREIFCKGSPGDSLMAVLNGRVKISSLSPEGKEIILNIINPGEIFGEIALLDGKDRTADAAAMTDCELLVVSRRDFMPFLERRADLCLLLLSVLCARLRRTSEQLEDVSFRHLQSRLAKTLLRLGRKTGAPKGRPIQIDLKLSQRDLANIVGGTRESINKHLHVLEKSGAIGLERGAVVIKDVTALERLA